jgi:hypothetical protein
MSNNMHKDNTFHPLHYSPGKPTCKIKKTGGAAGKVLARPLHNGIIFLKFPAGPQNRYPAG